MRKRRRKGREKKRVVGKREIEKGWVIEKRGKYTKKERVRKFLYKDKEREIMRKERKGETKKRQNERGREKGVKK